MVRFHPQWLRARELAQSGAIGEVRAIQTAFTYFNVNPDNVRNLADIGGGGLYDIGCYAVATARFIFGAEPERVIATFDRDLEFGTDRLTSGLMEFPGGRQFNFSVPPNWRATSAYRFAHARADRAADSVQCAQGCGEPLVRRRLFRSLAGGGMRVEEPRLATSTPCRCKRLHKPSGTKPPWPYPAEDAVNNMRVIDALFRSGKSGRWESSVI